MSHSDVGALDEDERRIYWQAISQADLAGAHAVQRMLDADPAWAKFVWDGNPRFHRDVWLEYGRILEMGFGLTPDVGGQWGDGVVSHGGRELCRVRIGEDPSLFVRLSLAAAASDGKEVSEIIGAIEGAATVTDWSSGHVDVEVPLVGADHGSVAKVLHGLKTRVERPAEPEARSCAEVLRDAGIGVPKSFADIINRAEALGDWYWSTDAELTHPEPEYLMEDAEWLLQPAPDQVVVSHWGHGVNSYALTVRLALGRVALHAQVGYGGAIMGLDAGAAAVTQLLHECAALVGDGASWDASPKGRAVVVRWSGLENDGYVRTWNERMRRWDDVPLQGGHPLAVAQALGSPTGGA